MSLEASAIALTTAVVKAAAKIWLGDRPIAADASAKALDLLEKQVTGLNDRRKLRLLFTNLESRVADRLLPFLDVEFRALPENERAAAVDAVRETFDEAALTDDDLFATDLDAAYLYRYLLRTVPGVTTLLSADATELYQRVLRECCAYLVQVTSTLPRFQPGALVEVLRRETEILETVRNVLAALPERRHPEDFAADFRRQVVTALDRMALFGAGLTDATRLYPLSVAYLSLTVSTDREGMPADRIEHVLPQTRRILIRGEAGSGKTTMLQWLAVKCANRELRNIDGWDDLEPFLVRLRQFSWSPLPAPERFLDDVGRHIADEMPKGWVHRRLRQGRAVVLVDGIDELPEERRPEVREWLGELIETFPRARYVVTTRPAAVGPGWLSAEDFTEVRLQPMTPRDVRTFVTRWHAAMGEHLAERRDALVAAIGTRSALRRLAENPLLCALLCALHHEGNGQLPDNRMELYEVALRMLLDSRDVERRIESDVRLSLTEKLVLLRYLAYWLVRNGHADIAAEDAETRIAAKLASMGQIDASPHKVFRHLLDRGGVLREPVPGRIDFVHRTFGEYLAAKAAVEEDDIGILVANADRDDWREVVVLAAGHAYPAQREKLIQGILDRRVTQLSLVALACLETSPELPDRLRSEIHRRTAALIPPKNKGRAEFLAKAGEFVLDLLAECDPAEPETAAATVRAIGLIGGQGALELLTRFGGRSDPAVVKELVAARERFDPAEYAESVLAHAVLPDGYLHVTDPALLDGLEHLRYLEKLDCWFEAGYGDLGFVRKLPRLRSLGVGDLAGFDLRSLAGTALERITLMGNPLPGSVDIGVLADIPGLTTFITDVETHGWSRFARLRHLEHLQLSWVQDPGTLAELTPLSYLPSLALYQVADLTDLNPVSFLAAPRTLSFDSCRALRDISAVTEWSASLTDLRLRSCPAVDLAPLGRLTELRTLQLVDVDEADLTPLAGKAGLTVRVTDGTRLAGAGLLGPGSEVERR
ncbi:NACHT domain-containing protein [Amycolatopsis sp. NPDC049691]|uniref:NACHT domain-containing protein n=1 Tax=Amycolatopsis sp. NPDC049691 TaxID=3155155 RepID=UPI0034223180